MSRHGILHRNRQADLDDTGRDTRPVETGEYARTPDDDRTYATRPIATAEPVDTTSETRVGWVRVSGMATLGLIVGLVSLGTTLTGLLAPEGLVLGAVGALLSIFGLVRASRPGITGHSLALIGLLCSLGAIALAALAMTGDYAWPNSSTDEVGRAHDWLVDKWSWLGRWD